MGTAKAGTTSIYEYLKQHEEIQVPVKETFFFLRDLYINNELPYPQQRPKKDLVLTENDYNIIYESADTDKITGEIGTGYLYHFNESVPHIKETLGLETRVCIILRNPIDRCFSSYMHFVKDLHETGTFEDALEKESERIAHGWDFMWHHKALGLYAEQVEHFLNHFPNVQVWLYDDLAADPIRTMNEITAFIGAKPKDDWVLSRVFNPSGKVKNARIQKFITHENPVKSILRPVFRLFFSKEKREKIRKGAKNKNIERGAGLTEAQRAMLRNFYKDDIVKLSGLISRDLGHWLN